MNHALLQKNEYIGVVVFICLTDTVGRMVSIHVIRIQVLSMDLAILLYSNSRNCELLNTLVSTCLILMILK